MDREAFKTLSSRLTKGSKVRIRLAYPHLCLPMEFMASIKDRGPSYIEVGIKGIRGLRRFLFNQVDWISVPDDRPKP